MSEEQELKIGDVVQLKSGGPRMTIELIVDRDGTIYCVWFEKTDKKKASFSKEMLNKIDQNNSGIYFERRSQR